DRAMPAEPTEPARTGSRSQAVDSCLEAWRALHALGAPRGGADRRRPKSRPLEFAGCSGIVAASARHGVITHFGADRGSAVPPLSRADHLDGARSVVERADRVAEADGQPLKSYFM